MTAPAIAVPAFVVRGAALWSAGFEQVSWRSEADLRDALASAWWMHGAEVRTEVKVPDCGRIDILVSAGISEVVIEVKKKIRTPTEARQAFQQAHAYLSYLDADDPGMDRRAFVVAADYDHQAATAANRAYPGVAGVEYVAIMRWPELRDTWFEHATEVMVATARRRHETLQHLAGFSRGALMHRVHAAEAGSLAELAS